MLPHGGSFGSTYEMGRFIDSLSRTYQVIAIPTRGHGNSEPGTAPLTYEQRANDVAALLMVSSALAAQAQQYSSLTTAKPVVLGKAPGLKVKLPSASRQVKTYVLIFAKGDEMVSGLTEFAQKYHVKSAHYQAIGDALSAKVGVFDYGRQAFKVIPFAGPIEMSSLTGDITVYNGKQKTQH